MIGRALAGAVLAGALAAPALALEHDIVIDHAAGPIAADYRGTLTIAAKQVGAAGAAGRPSTLVCVWSASLTVERQAKIGSALRSRRTLTREGIAKGSRAGWCPSDPQALDALVDAGGEKARAALLALVEQDRAQLLAEADSAAIRG